MIGIEIDDPGGTLELFKELTMGASAKLSLRSGWLLLLLLIGGCWMITVAYQAFTGITREQEKQLHDGMTKEEVIRVLGMPHGGETIDRDFWIYWTYPRTFDPLKLGFDKDGRLRSVSN